MSAETIADVVTPNENFEFRLERWTRPDGTQSVYLDIVDVFDGNEETFGLAEFKALIEDLQALRDKWVEVNEKETGQ